MQYMSCVEFMSMMMYLILKFDLVFTYFLRKMGKHTNIFVTKVVQISGKHYLLHLLSVTYLSAHLVGA